MLHKDFSLEIKAVDSAGQIEGYASTFGGSPDSYGDIVKPGAFADSLVQHKRAGTMPLMLWGHDTSQPPIGGWNDMAEDGKGLWVKGQIDLEDPMGQRVHRSAQRKSIRTMSIGYSTVESSADPKKQGIRYLEKVDLYEVSPVNFAANPRAVITAVKDAIERGEMPTVREFENFLRDTGGFSNSKAVALASACAPHLRGEPEAKADELAEFLRGLRA